MIKRLFQDALQDLLKIQSFFSKARTVMAFRRLKRKALKLHREFNCQVFIVKMDGRIQLISKYQFKQLRQRGYLKKDFNADDLKKIALFYTPKRYDKAGTKRSSGKV